MSYRIAGIDVHKKMLAVVVSDVEIESEYQFARRMFWQQPRTTAIAGGLAARARGRRSSHGIDSTILETSLGSIGTVLETATPEAGRRKPQIGNVTSGAAAIEPRAAGTQEGFPGCRTPGKATGGPGVDSELCARCRAASVADGDTQEVPVDARSRAAAEPIGVSSGRPTLSYPAWSPICWVSVPVVC